MASYIQRSLGQGENVIALARFHWLYSLRALLSVLAPAVLLLALYIAKRPTRFDPSDPLIWLFILLAVWLVLGFFNFLRMTLRRKSTEIGVTSHRFVEKYGVLAMRTNEIAIANIEGVRVNQSMLGRLLNFGTVRIEGTGVDAVMTPVIADPVGFVRAIQTAREHQVARLAPGPASGL